MSLQITKKSVTYTDLCSFRKLGSSARLVLKECINRGAEVYLLYDDEAGERFFSIYYEDLIIPLRSNNLNLYTLLNSRYANAITTDKLKTYVHLLQNDIPTPKTVLYSDEKHALDFMTEHGRVVVKPLDGAHGEGITMHVETIEDLSKAVTHARQISEQVLLQKELLGDDFRLLFIDYAFVAAVKRVPAFVIGTGTETVAELVEQENNRKSQLLADLSSGKIDDSQALGSISTTPLEEIVSARGEDFLAYIPQANEHVALVDKANVSLGGQTVDVTDQVSADLVKKIESVMRAYDLALCGVDVLSTDISSSTDSSVIEINSAPGLRLHECPYEGAKREISSLVVDKMIEKSRVLKNIEK